MGHHAWRPGRQPSPMWSLPASLPGLARCRARATPRPRAASSAARRPRPTPPAARRARTWAAPSHSRWSTSMTSTTASSPPPAAPRRAAKPTRWAMGGSAAGAGGWGERHHQLDRCAAAQETPTPLAGTTACTCGVPCCPAALTTRSGQKRTADWHYCKRLGLEAQPGGCHACGVAFCART